MNTSKRRLALASVLSLALIAAACGSDDEAATTTEAPAGETTEAPGADSTVGAAETTAAPSDSTEAPAEDLSGDIAIDGSSTVAPLMKLAAEDFQDANGGVTVAVGTSGTGGGFEKFCAGETDISNASRPIKDEEATACADAGVEYVELIVANDALSVVVNPDNDWATCLTVEQLKTMWEPAAEDTITNWNQIDPSFPDESLTLFGAGTDSGTFDYFTKAINGEEGAIRADYSPSEDDNITVQGVAGALGGIGFFGLSYVEENADVIKAVTVDGVYPTIETVQDGSYTPLGRPLFIYVANASYTDKPEVKAFVDYFVANALEVAEAALFVPLTDAQIVVAADELALLAK